VKIIDTSFDAKTRAALNAVLNEVSRNLPKGACTLDVLAVEAEVAMHLIKASIQGETNPSRLRAMASEIFATKG
jgi:hypothetical protein